MTVSTKARTDDDRDARDLARERSRPERGGPGRSAALDLRLGAGEIFGSWGPTGADQDDHLRIAGPRCHSDRG